MSDFRENIEDYLVSSVHLSKRHVHPKMLSMLEMGGMNAVFTRAEGQYLFDTDGNRYLDFLAGGGVYFIGRNHPDVHQACVDVLSMNLPNLTIVNASALGGQVAERLLALAGPTFSKVIYANSGTECTDVMVRFARYVTGRRRFLFLEGGFHGRSYAATSLCGWNELKQGQEPLLPTCTPIRANDLKQLRRELKYGDVAGVIFEPVQGMTGEVMDPSYLREAENLCERHGSILMADEVQTGLGRTGAWFASVAAGVRPHMMSVSKTLSGGAVPVGAVVMNEDIYDRVYNKFQSGPIYFSTFAENNLAMTAALKTLDVLEDMDAPAEAARKEQLLRDGIADIASRWDCIDRVQGKGLLMVVYFKDSGDLNLLAQQKMLQAADNAAFGAAVNAQMYKKHNVVVQIPGPGLNAIKILPPVTSTEEDIRWFLAAFEDTIADFYGRQGPVVSLGKAVVGDAMSKVTELLPEGAVPPMFNNNVVSRVLGRGGDDEKKNPES